LPILPPPRAVGAHLLRRASGSFCAHCVLQPDGRDAELKVVHEWMKPVTAAAVSLALAASPAFAQNNWNKPTEPFHVINVYYVGTEAVGLPVHDAEGHILLDGATPQGAPIIEANITKLGFKSSDDGEVLLERPRTLRSFGRTVDGDEAGHGRQAPTRRRAMSPRWRAASISAAKTARRRARRR